MKLLVTSNDHPCYDRVGVVTSVIPAGSIQGIDEPLLCLEFGNGQRTTVVEGEYKVVKIQDD